METLKKPIGFLRTTAIGGLLFLLPLIVVGALIGQIAPIVYAIYTSLEGILSGFMGGFLLTPGGIALLIVLSIGILLLICFAAGLIARRAFMKRLSQAFEKKLLLLFPRYAILKDQMADTIGGDENRPQMKPVLVRFDDCKRIGFETERNESLQTVVVYLPGSPDPWAGKVAIVDSERVTSLKSEFGDTTATCEQLGRGSTALVEALSKDQD